MPTDGSVEPDESGRVRPGHEQVERGDQSDEQLDREGLLHGLAREQRTGASRAVLFHAAVAAEAGINTTDVTALAILDKDGPQTAGQLAEAMTLSRGGAITALLDRLERAGFVQRRRDTTDRRRVLVELTPEGNYAKLQQLFEEFGAEYRALLEGYDESELALLLEFFRRTNAVLQRHTLSRGQPSD